MKRLGFLVVAPLFGAGISYSQTLEWDHGGADTNFNNKANWVGDVAPGTNSDLLFSDAGGLGPQAVTLTAAATVNSMLFDSTAGYTLGGTSMLTFGTTAVPGTPSILITDSTPNGGSGPKANHDINSNVTIAEPLAITNNSIDNLTFNGNLTNNGGITVDGPGAVSIDSAFYDGAGSITKNGTGTLFIRKGNYGAPPHAINVNAGVLSLDSPSAVYDSTPTAGNVITVAPGASIEMSDSVSQNGIPSANVTGTGVNYGTQGDLGAVYGAPGPKGTLYTTQLTMNMTGNTSFGAFEGVTYMIGGILPTDGAANYDFTKVGAGVVRLNNAQITSLSQGWTGNTIIKEGMLSSDAISLPGGFTTPAVSPRPGYMVLDGGVFGVTSTDNFTRSVGTGPNQITWKGDGGFASVNVQNAYKAFNLGGAAAPLTWGAGGFVPTGSTFIMGDEQSNGFVLFANPINLGSSLRDVEAIKGLQTTSNSRELTAHGELDGVLSGTGGGIHKTGDGVLALTATNTYTGETRISDGALALVGRNGGAFTGPGTLGTSKLVLDGGVFIPPSPTYTPTLGTGAGNVSWSGNGGGFAGYYLAVDGVTTPPTVTLNNDPTTALTWGTTPNFLHNGETLTLGSEHSYNSITLNNTIDLGGATRTIQVENGTKANTVDAILPQTLSNGGLNIVGDGDLALRAANTNLKGPVTVKGANLTLDTMTASLPNAASINLSEGGKFSLAGTIAAPSGGHIGDSVPINLNSGSLSSAMAAVENAGPLSLTGGANVIDTSTISSGQGFNFASLSQANHATVNFTKAGTSSTQDTFTATPSLTGGVLPYATVNGADFATYNSPSGIISATSAATGQASWTSSVNYKGSGETLTAARTVNSLALTTGATVGGAYGLTVSSGGILSTGTSASTISTSTLKSATGDLFVHTNSIDNYGLPAAGPALTISSAIQNASVSQPTALVKTGIGTLSLTGSTPNTYTGDTIVQAGVLALNKTPGTNAIAGNAIVGDGGGTTDVLRLDGSEQIANTSTVTLKSGDYASGSSTLLFNGPTATSGPYTGQSGVSETFHQLGIDGPSTLDFSGGLNDAPNYLFLDLVTMASGTSSLNVTNWENYKDFFLIKDPGNMPDIASQIHFDGYEGSATITKYNDDYWQITPYGPSVVVPEPSTCGLALIGIGAACGIRRRKPAVK